MSATVFNNNKPYIKNRKARWSEEDLTLLSQLIDQNRSIREISIRINRSEPAITTKGNELGYGYHTNRLTGLKYFKKTINHKKRRTKAEMLEDKGCVSALPQTQRSQGADIEVINDIIPHVEINLIDIDRIIQILTTARDNATPERNSDNTAGGAS